MNMIVEDPVSYEQLLSSPWLNLVRGFSSDAILQEICGYMLRVMAKNQERGGLEDVQQECKLGNPGRWMMMIVLRRREADLQPLVFDVLEKSLAFPQNRDRETYLRGAHLVRWVAVNMVQMVYILAAVPDHMRCQWSVDIASFSETAFGRRSEIMRKFAVCRWDRLRVIAPLTGRIARYVRILFNEVHYCPGGRGASKARDNFQKLAKKHLE